MIVGLSSMLAMALASVAPATQLVPQDRQDTIYILHGEKAALESFREQVGNQWTGGVVIDDQSAKDSLKYWAYSARTAAESRAFMMPAMFLGLELDFDTYDESKAFPLEREKLDLVAVQCGAKIDPFFITPLRSIEITVPESAELGFVECLSKGISQAGIQLPLSSSHRSEEPN